MKKCLFRNIYESFLVVRLGFTIKQKVDVFVVRNGLWQVISKSVFLLSLCGRFLLLELSGLKFKKRELKMDYSAYFDSNKYPSLIYLDASVLFSASRCMGNAGVICYLLIWCHPRGLGGGFSLGSRLTNYKNILRTSSQGYGFWKMILWRPKKREGVETLWARS